MRLIPGRQYRVIKKFPELTPELTVGTVITYKGTQDYLDWYQCEVEVAGKNILVGAGLPNYVEEVPN